MSETISREDAVQFVAEAELMERDGDKFADLQKVLGKYKLDPMKMNRAALKRFVESRLNMGVTMASIAEELCIPLELVPTLINVVLGEEGLEAIRKGQAKMMASLAGMIAPQALTRLEEVITKGKHSDIIKAIQLLAQILQITGPQTLVQQNNVSLGATQEMKERYDPSNLERLLGRKIAVLDGEGQTGEGVGRSEDPGRDPLGNEGEYSPSLRLVDVDPRPSEEGELVDGVRAVSVPTDSD